MKPGPDNTDTKGAKVSVLSRCPKDRTTSQAHVLSTQKLKKTFLRQQDVEILNCKCNKFKLKKSYAHLSFIGIKLRTSLFLKHDNGAKVPSALAYQLKLMMIVASKGCHLFAKRKKTASNELLQNVKEVKHSE